MSGGIYIHVPYCRRRCPYCDFYLVVGKADSGFADALISEWQERFSSYGLNSAHTLYFGGGTPSLLPDEALAKIINELKNSQSLDKDAEITVEANPEDLSQQKLSFWQSIGINRLSLGVQSFDDEVLRFLGRKHKSLEAYQALDLCLDNGFENISIDYIIGGTSLDAKKALNSLALISHKVKHISAYLLTVEEGTHFYKKISKGKMQNPCDDMQAIAYRALQEDLIKRGFVQYDISSYAQPGFFSRHNQLYWSMNNYLGLGPSAHSLLCLPDGSFLREQNPSNLNEWLKNPHDKAKLIRDHLKPEEALLESLAFGLRNMRLGIRPQDLAQKHKVQLPKGLDVVLEKYIKYGYLNEKNGAYTISTQGALFGDAIMRDIISL